MPSDTPTDSISVVKRWLPQIPLRDSLIHHPTTLEDHCKNLAIMATVGTKVSIEMMFRQTYPEVTREQYLQLIHSEQFNQEWKRNLRAHFGIENVAQILSVQVDRALKGDLASAKFILEQVLGEKDRTAEDTASFDSFLDRMAGAVEKAIERKRPERLVEVKADVK